MKTTIILFVCLAFLFVAANSIEKNGASDPFNIAEHVSFNKPDEVREFPLGKVELVKIGGALIGRATFEPGWRWSTSVKPIVKTDMCEAPHFQYHISGTLRILMQDGSTFDCKPGDLSNLPSGHDAWVVGDEAVVVVDFQGMIDYAKVK
jgi:hypothetical protein